MNFAEQLRRHLPEIGRKPPIKPLSLSVLLEQYLNDMNDGMDPARAWRHLATMLETNLRTALGEGIGDREISEYGVRVTVDNGRIVFHDLQGKEILSTQRAHNQIFYKNHPDVIAYFNKELDAWEKAWGEFVAPLTDLIGETNTREKTSQLEGMGWRKRDEQTPTGLKALFQDELGGVQNVELWEHPIKKVLVSPPHPLHHNGETSIARLVRFVYIPSINQFAFLECGLFTAYTSEQITQFFTLDGKGGKPRFENPEDILSYVVNLAENLNELPPNAVFNEIIKIIGYFRGVGVDGSIADSKIPRTLDTQIAYALEILKFEAELCKDPALRATAWQRLTIAEQLVLHSLLRATELDVKNHVANYIATYSNRLNALKPFRVMPDLRNATVSAHPDFANRVFSVFDCGQGTMLGGLQTFGSGSLLPTLGLDKFSMLQKLIERGEPGITSRHELERVCHLLGKNPDLYSKMGRCGLCGKLTFVWPFENGGCSVCPACEYLDDLGLSPSDFDLSPGWQGKNPPFGKLEQNNHPQIGLSVFVASMFSAKKPEELIA